MSLDAGFVQTGPAGIVGRVGPGARAKKTLHRRDLAGLGTAMQAGLAVSVPCKQLVGMLKPAWGRGAWGVWTWRGAELTKVARAGAPE